MSRHKRTPDCLRLIILSLGFCMAGDGLAQEGPEYTKDGKQLLLPQGFEKWVFVGADLGLGYTEEVRESTPRESARNAAAPAAAKTDAALNPGDFHNIYLSPDAYDEYTSGDGDKFPEGTVLVMDVYASEQKEPQRIVNRGSFEAERKMIEVAVKNSKRPDKTSESQKAWAYYVFSKQADGTIARAATAAPDKDCFACHAVHADVDNVWVQFYPVIRK